MSVPRRVLMRTYGCQMNVHDSEKVANLLHHHGYTPTDRSDEADLLIINTCSIREKAEHQLYSDLGMLRAWKEGGPGRVLAVGGCVAQQQGAALLRRFRHLDFVFGTHHLRLVPAMADAARAGMRAARTEESLSPERFDFPERHPDFSGSSPGRAFVTVMEGCDMFCSFCIVPHTRGREISRPVEAVLAEVEELARHGVCEVTLLGQTVNAWGRHLRRREQARRSRGADASASPGFAELLRWIASVPGIRRIRYTSPHPIFFDADLVRAHAELPALCPHVHLPLQSGSDAVLARMRRRYDRDGFRRIAADLRQARPDLALTTDLIVGFPGESDADFRATLELVEELAFVDSYSFKYSPRPGTAAAALPDPVPPEVAQARLEELQALQKSLTFAAHAARVGQVTELLVTGPSRHGGGQLSGRDVYHRLVNFEPPASADLRPGQLLMVRLLAATPHSLLGEALAGGVKPGPPQTDEVVAIQGVPI